MELNHCKEEFSIAYVKAVASAAGLTVDRPSVDLDSVDIVISSRSRTGHIRSPRLDAQLKCTASDAIRGDVIKFPLKRKNYDDLIPDNVMVPRILVVVLVPSDPGAWIEQSEQQLAMRHCGYWVSLRGKPPTENEQTVTVEIPRAQVFSVEALRNIMREIGEGVFR